MSDTIAAIKHYQLQAYLGEGGFGQVFAAWDTKLQRSVAIKRLKNNDQSNTTLLREARLAASLQHSAFVKIHALEDDDNSQAIVMELVQGQTLKQVLVNTTLDATQAINILRQIAEAMQQAHTAGLIHGDLKPSNLMLEAAGTIRILDFGLASMTDAQATTSMLQQDPQGTIAYMAPERLLGAALTPLVDIYALGVILYELLTGVRPFAHLNGLALAAALVQSSSDQWDYPSDLPPTLIQFIRRMTTKLPAQRLNSMAEIIVKLDKLEDGTSITENILPAFNLSTVKEIQNPTKKLRDAKTKRVIKVAICVLALVLIGGWLTYTYLNTLKKIVLPFSESQEMEKGMAALEQWERPESLDEAIQYFSNLAEHNAENAAAIAGLSIAYSLRYSSTSDEIWSQKAAASAQQAIKIDPHLALSQIAIGRLLLDTRQLNSAWESFEKALSLDPLNILAWAGKIDLLHEMQRDKEAIDLAGIASHKFPKSSVFSNQMGLIYTSQGKYLEAEQAFRQSIKIQPDSIYAYLNLGGVLQYQGQTEEALHVLQQGLHIRPSTWLYTNLGNIYFFKGEYVNAVSAFEAAVSPKLGNVGDYLSWANLADALQWIPGRKQEAEKYYKKARQLLAPILKRRPDDTTLASRMAVYNARLGDRKQCKTLLALLANGVPMAPVSHFRTGLAYELIGDRGSALKQITIAHNLGYPLKMIEAEPDLEPLRRDPQYTLR